MRNFYNAEELLGLTGKFSRNEYNESGGGFLFLPKRTTVQDLIDTGFVTVHDSAAEFIRGLREEVNGGYWKVELPPTQNITLGGYLYINCKIAEDITNFSLVLVATQLACCVAVNEDPLMGMKVLCRSYGDGACIALFIVEKKVVIEVIDNYEETLEAQGSLNKKNMVPLDVYGLDDNAT